ncbi:hypothetical protein B4168_0561 [Anoxybacillus flavithermus]|nr:hypothetical protein B4168_0561 [Anoxybacillus flavithermus]OAO86571.1 hypothetical protein GT23_1589 [Parageobacillus thermoglucosidasius]
MAGENIAPHLIVNAAKKKAIHRGMAFGESFFVSFSTSLAHMLK